MKTSLNPRVLALLLATSCCGVVAHAQPAPTAATSGSLQQFLSGDLVPLDLKFSQMQSGWSRVHIERKGENQSAPETADRPFDPIAMGFKRYFGEGSNAVWTQGHTVNLNGAEQLVVYRAVFPSLNETVKWYETHMPAEVKAAFAPGSRNAPDLDVNRAMDIMFPAMRQFLDTVPLRASLINANDIASLRDVEPFSFERAFTAFERDVRDQIFTSELQRQQNREQSSRTSLELLAQGLEQYILDYDDVLPPLESWEIADKALHPYIKSKIELAQTGGQIYANPLLSKKKMAHLAPYENTFVVFYTSPDNQNNRWVVMLNGEVKSVGANQWPQIKKASRLP